MRWVTKHTLLVYILVSSCPLSAVCRDINCGAAGVRAMIYRAAGYCYSGKYYYGVGVDIHRIHRDGVVSLSRVIFSLT